MKLFSHFLIFTFCLIICYSVQAAPQKTPDIRTTDGAGLPPLSAEEGYWRLYHDIEGSSNQVQRLQWEDNPEFLNAIIALGKPVVLVGSPALRWNALRWTPRKVQDRLGELHNVLVQNASMGSAFFRGLLQPRERTPYTLQVLMAKDFLDRAEAASAGSEEGKSPSEYLYWDGRIGVQAPWLLEELENGERFTLSADDGYYTPVLEGKQCLHPELGELEVPRDATASAHMFVASKGVTAQSHFDQDLNFNVQVYGRKQWWLWPPSAWTGLYPYPPAHPRVHQSQVNYSSVDAEKYPRFSGVHPPPLHVETTPGDVLFVPAYWFHRVKATSTLCLSLPHFSPSIELLLFRMSQHVPMPLAKVTGKKSKTAVAAYIAVEVAKRVLGNDVDAMRWGRTYYEAHFQHLDAELREHSTLPADWNCFNRGHELPKIPIRLAEDLEASVDALECLFNKMRSDVVPLMLGYYVDGVAEWAAGGSQNVFLFYKYCLAGAE